MRLYRVSTEKAEEVHAEADPDDQWDDDRGANFEKAMDVDGRRARLCVVIAHDDADFVKTVIVRRGTTRREP